MGLAAPLLLLTGLLALPVWLLAGRPRGRAAALPALGGLDSVRPSWRVRALRLLPFARAAAVLLLALALARPRIGDAQAIIPAEGVDIVLALDISSSMEGYVPQGRSRLDSARHVIREFVANRENDRLGVVVFQKDALALAPLSLDYEAIDRVIADVESGLLEDGTGIGVGIGESLNLLRESSAKSRIVILLTDGEQNAASISPESAAELAAALRIRVYTIGLGDERPSVVPANVDEERMRAVAERTGGRHFSVDSEQGLTEVYDEIARLERSRVGAEQFARHTELGPWLALVGAGLLLVEVLARLSVLRVVPA